MNAIDFKPKSDFLEAMLSRGFVHQCSDFEGLDAKAVSTDLLERGLIVNAVTPTTVRLLPPLTVSDTEVDEAVGLIRSSLAAQLARAEEATS